MARFRFLILAALAFLMMGCPDPKPPTDSTSNNTTGSSVYDSNSAFEDETVAEDMIVEDLDVEDAPVTYEVDRLEIDDSTSTTLDLDLEWEPIYFEFDKAVLTDEARQSLNLYSQVLKGNPNLRVLLEGHCDIRGTEEYNMALGERRAQQVKRYLLELGVADSRMKTISYGELRPLDPTDSESSWAKNRRVSFTF